MAARILSNIASRGRVPSRALTALAEANHPTTPLARATSLGQNSKTTRRGDIQQEEIDDGHLTPESDEHDSDYSYGSHRWESVFFPGDHGTTARGFPLTAGGSPMY